MNITLSTGVDRCCTLLLLLTALGCTEAEYETNALDVTLHVKTLKALELCNNIGDNGNGLVADACLDNSKLTARRGLRFSTEGLSGTQYRTAITDWETPQGWVAVVVDRHQILLFDDHGEALDMVELASEVVRHDVVTDSEGAQHLVVEDGEGRLFDIRCITHNQPL